MPGMLQTVAGLALTIAIALAALASQAAAQPLDKPAAAKALLDKFVAESRVILNCSALDHQTHDIARRHVFDFAAQSVIALMAAPQLGVDAGRFAQDSAYQNLIMKDKSFAEVMAFCDANKDWIEKFSKFDIVLLPMELKKLIDR